jgi:hypothetical protein
VTVRLLQTRLRVITAAELSASAPGRWLKHYQHHLPSDLIGGRPVRETSVQLAAIDPTPSEVARILNPSWAYPTCGSCNQYVPAAAECGDAWAESKPVICLPCAEQIVSLLRQFPGADEPVPQTSPISPVAAGELP